MGRQAHPFEHRHDHPPEDCVVFDVSAGGAKLSLRDGLGIGEWVALTLRFGTFRAKVAWKNESRIGLAFDHEPADVVIRIPATSRRGPPLFEQIDGLAGPMH